MCIPLPRRERLNCSEITYSSIETSLCNMEVSWGLRKQDKSRIEEVQMRLLSKLLGVCRMDHIINEKIREQLVTALRWKIHIFGRWSGERMWTIVAQPPRKVLDCKQSNRPSSVGKTWREQFRAAGWCAHTISTKRKRRKRNKNKKDKRISKDCGLPCSILWCVKRRYTNGRVISRKVTF